MTSNNQYQIVEEVTHNVKIASYSQIESIINSAEAHISTLGDRGINLSEMPAFEKLDYLLPEINYR